MALQNAQTVAVQLEKVRKKLPILYERSDTFFSMIHKRGDVEKVSTRTARIPLQTNPGGNFGYAGFDGSDLGRGSGTEYDYAQVTPVGLRFAVEITKLVEYATNASDKAVADVTKKNVGDAMRQFRRDIDAQLQTAGNAICATVNLANLATNTLTLADTPFGARLVRKNMKVQIMDAAQANTRGSCTITGNVNSQLGKAQTVVVDLIPPGVIATDVVIPDGLAGASPVGVYGLPYHHNSSTLGTWMGISRANSYAVADLVPCNNSGLALPFLRLAVDKIMQNIGMDEEAALKNLLWYGHRMQKAAYHEIAASISMLQKEGGEQDVDLMFRSETIGGVKTKWSIHADPTRLDLLNLDTWGRVEWKEIDYLEIGDETVFPVYGQSGGIAAAYLFYLVAGEQYFIDNPKAVGGLTGLAVLSGYTTLG
jgi:hypothetical protein